MIVVKAEGYLSFKAATRSYHYPCAILKPVTTLVEDKIHMLGRSLVFPAIAAALQLKI